MSVCSRPSKGPCDSLDVLETDFPVAPQGENLLSQETMRSHLMVVLHAISSRLECLES